MADELRICVTGLSRAGKTAFITALADALRNAHHAPASFPAWAAAAQGRWRGARILPPGGALSTLEAFPFEANRRALTAIPPRWPGGTEAVRALTLDAAVVEEPGPLGQAWRWANRQAGRPMGESIRALRVTVVDYPGEWALDLPLREADFAAWSAATLARIAQGPRAAIAGPFLEALAALDPFAAHDERLARRAQRAFLAFLERCRDELRLSFLQPGLFLRPEKIGGREALLANDAFLFAPLPLPPGATARDAPAGSAWHAFAARFDGYRRDQVDAFFESLAGPGETRQVVLFDLLSALAAGPAAYEDAREALEAVAQAMRPRLGFLARLFGGSVRVLFAGTKADLLPAIHRDRIRRHLEAIVTGIQAGTADRQLSRTLAVAAIAATRSGTDGQGRPVVAGTLRDPQTGEVQGGRTFRFPPPPAGPPTEADWEAWAEAGIIGYRLPEFFPDARDLKGRPDMPHVNLDAAIEFLLGDHG